MVKKLIIIILSLFTTSTNFNQDYTYVDKEINIFKEVEREETTKVLATYKGNITAYGPDCVGCSGITASGYKVKNTIYYNDKEYGKIRIVAADRSLPFGTIIRISDLKIIDEPIIAIVLDRGGAIGFKKNVYFDLLYKNEKSTNTFGKQKAKFEILRRGY